MRRTRVLEHTLSITIGWLVRTSSNSADMLSRDGLPVDWGTADRRGWMDDRYDRFDLQSFADVLERHGLTPHLVYLNTRSVVLGRDFQVSAIGCALTFRDQVSLVTAKGSRWEATSFCKCTPTSPTTLFVV